MSMLSRTSLKPYKLKIMEELKADRGIKDPSADQVLDHLFGDHDGWSTSRYTVKRYREVKSNIVQRFNALWVYPLYFVFIAPLKWIITGCTGVKSESRAWKFLQFLLGDPK